uniref:Prolyl 4-hydroxylase alpha subunit domain-containing protein n=1 Tax=Chlamydomonas leiostraca TaxID=1034604 RepID=A0A7S0X0K2_9CHLO|mmetsp:Transcript_7378/g.18320  ORF Transcript_7378/g.18320 Transcript_7378/m.18320 type:complete len:363 (+) Transcript_7378:120-1208(+)
MNRIQPAWLRLPWQQAWAHAASRGMAAMTDASMAQLTAAASARIQTAIAPEVCKTLTAQGYAVVDNLFDPKHAELLRQEIVQLYQGSRMHKNHTHLVRDNTTRLLEKGSIHEAELTLNSNNAQQAAPLCARLNADTTLRTMLSLLTPGLTLDMQAIKLQYNAGEGGCFPIHADTDASLDGRRVTSIFYLNPGWQPSHGGQLKLYPWPLPPVEIAPLHNRLVLFTSHTQLHRVTPSFAPDGRCCFTIWLSQSRGRRVVRAAPASPLSSLQPATSPEQDPGAAVKFLMTPSVRLHAAKLALSGEWEESLRQSHKPGPELHAMLAQHRAEVALIGRALGKYSGVMQRLQQEPQLAQSAAASISWL